MDATYAEELRRALDRGVEAICYRCAIDTDGIEVDGPLTIVF
ncbi:MAG: hypothetical protein QF491_14045 [Alphaproteobacteria bacterium]|nr:hypothetical protein [Alphaproteobacteria bacterium]